MSEDTQNQKSHGLFSTSPKPKTDTTTLITELSNQVNNISRRIRIIEERYSSLRRQNQVNEQNTLETDKKIFSEIRTSFEEIKELRHEISEMKDNLKLIISELQLLAKKEDVQVLERYINMWEPVNFVTINQVKKIVKEEVEKAIFETSETKQKKIDDLL